MFLFITKNKKLFDLITCFKIINRIFRNSQSIKLYSDYFDKSLKLKNNNTHFAIYSKIK